MVKICWSTRSRRFIILTRKMCRLRAVLYFSLMLLVLMALGLHQQRSFHRIQIELPVPKTDHRLSCSPSSSQSRDTAGLIVLHKGHSTLGSYEPTGRKPNKFHENRDWEAHEKTRSIDGMPQNQQVPLYSNNNDKTNVYMTEHPRNVPASQRRANWSDQNAITGWKPALDAGEHGLPVRLNKSQLNVQQRQALQDGWDQHGFNQFISDFISLNRTVPEIKEPGCRAKQYRRGLPTASVVVIFHNEAWSTLLRTVHSVLHRSPPRLLDQVILVDDFSDREHLGKPLDDYIARLSKVKVIRSRSREGLIKARLLGLSYVTSPIVVFMDSHCECADGWLEPLLDRIIQDPTTVAVPVIDAINANDFAFRVTEAKHIFVGTFDWYLRYQWMPIQEREKSRRNSDIEPIRTPTMAGGLFAIDFAFFTKLGTYDPGMKIWGGENLELSFRVWMCGGTLEIIPCSHVGHVFRNSDTSSTRGFQNYLSINLRRLTAVWLDEYSYYINHARGFVKENFTSAAIGNVSDRHALRNRLQCHSFAWYLKNIMPEMYLPADKIAHGTIRNEQSGLCIASSLHHYTQAQLKNCEENSFSQEWYMNMGESKVFQEGYFSGRTCLHFTGNGTVGNVQCNGNLGEQQWKYSKELKHLVHINSGLCAQVSRDDGDSAEITMSYCDPGNTHQHWLWDISPVPGPSWRKDIDLAQGNVL